MVRLVHKSDRGSTFVRSVLFYGGRGAVSNYGCSGQTEVEVVCGVVQRRMELKCHQTTYTNA